VIDSSPRRGHHKVFLGMAAGVGKTYQMLDEAREEQGRGRDVVIGYFEPHGRAETVAQAAGLELVPRQQIEYHGATLEEMDLSGILRRRPELCLIDELAHTNVSGTEHHKRYEDVDTVIRAGIDVYSTVNVQHVASLAKQITALTGAKITETLPDRVLDEADSVVLVDITPELLIERLQSGKVYRDPAAAEIALRNFFRPEKLATLREVALLHVTAELDHGRGPTDGQALVSRGQPVAARDRVLALATPDPRMRRIVHHAYLSARRLGAPLDVLWVRSRRSDPLAADDHDCAALDSLVTTLGGTMLVRDGRDLVGTIAEVAAERGATDLVMGQPVRRTALGSLAHGRLSLQLMRALPDLDLHIVALPRRP
jgi:two-component system, OmpR family, sensor histidine kinase KdpD